MPAKRGGTDRRAASSAASSVETSIASRRRSQLQQRQVLPSVDTVYPIFHQLELDVDWKLSVLNFIIETIHMTGLVVNTKFGLYKIGDGILEKLVVTTLVPFFDPTWFGYSDTASLVMLWTFIVLVTIMSIIFFVFALRNFKVMPTYLRWSMKLVFHALTTFCIPPLTINFTTYMLCDASGTIMLWHPDYACWSSHHLLYLVFSILGIIQLAGLLYINAGFIYADMPDSHDMTARPYSVVVLSMQFCRLLIFLVATLLVGSEQPVLMGALMAVVCGIQCGLHIFMLPYYNLRTNQIRVAQQAMLTTMAILTTALCTVSESSAWRTRNGSILLLCLSPLSFGIGWFATSWRINRRLCKAIENLASGTASDTAHYLDPPYPRYLPLHDLTYTRYPAIEKVLMGEAYFTMLNLQQQQQQEEEEERAERHAPREVMMDEEGPDIAPRDTDDATYNNNNMNVLSDMSVLEPYVTAVYVPHDVPLATRFLREYARQTATTTMTTPRMCAFAARIFTKGMARYPGSTMLIYEFCKFLAVYAGRDRMSLAELSRLRARVAYTPQTLSYRIYRLSERLRNDLHVANSDQIRLTSISSKLHKETLSAMHSLWTYLAAGSHRGEQIAHIADYITGKREQCKAFYIQSLREPHETTLLHYSHFLTNVMFDPQTGETLRQRIAEEREIVNAQRQSRKANAGASAGATSQRNAGGSFARSVALSTGNASSRWEACKMVLRESRSLGKYGGAGAGKASHVAQGYSAVKRLLISVYVAYLCLFLAAIAMIGLMVAHLHFLRWSIERVKVAGSVRLSVLMASLIVNEMAHAAELPFPDTEKGLFLQFCVENLKLAGANILSGHHRLMLGDLVTRDAAVSAWERDNRIEVIVPGTLSIEGNYSRTLKSLFNLGSELGNMFVDIANNYQTALPQIGYIAANVQEGSFSRAFNTSVTNAMTEQATVIRNMVWIFVAVTAFVLLLLVALYMLFVVYINRVEETKVAVVNLFTLIPKSYVEMFCRSSHSKILEFDEFEAHPEKILAAPLWEKKEQTTTHGPPLLAPPSPREMGLNDTPHSNSKSSPLNGKGNMETYKSNNPLRLMGQTPAVEESNTGIMTTTTTAGEKSSPTLLGASVNLDTETSNARETTIDDLLQQQQGDREAAAKALMARERWFHTAEKVIQQRTRQLRKRELMFTTRKFSSSLWTALRGFLTRETVQIWTMVFVAAVFLVLVALNAQAYDLAESVRAGNEEMTSLRQSANNYTEYLLYLNELAQKYVVNGDAVALYEYHDHIVENNYNELFDRVILYTPNQVTVLAAVNVRIVLNSALLCQRVALWLASDYYKVSADERMLLGQIFAMNQTYNFTAMEPLLAAVMAPYEPQEPTPRPTDNIHDALLPDATKIVVAHNLLFDDYNYHYYDVMKEYLDQMVNSYPNTVATLRDRLAVYRLVITVLLACALAALVILVCMTLLSKGTRVVVLIGLIGSIFLALIALVVTHKTGQNDALAQRVSTCYVNLISAYGSVSATLRLNRMNVLRLILAKDTRVQKNWEKTVSMTTYKDILSDAFNAYLVAMPQDDSSQLSYYMNDVFSNLHHILYFSEIAALLTMVAQGLKVSPALESFTYDRRLEYDYLKEYFNFGNRSYTYFNRDTDLGGSSPDPTVLSGKALNAVSGARYETVSRTFRSGATKTLDLISSQIDQRWNDVQGTIETYTMVSLYLCVAGMIVMLLTCVWSLYRSMSEAQRKKFNHDSESTSGTAHDAGRDAAAAANGGKGQSSQKGSHRTAGSRSADAAAAVAHNHKRNNHRRELFWLALTFFFIMALFAALLAIALYNTFSPRSSTLLGTLMTQNGAVLDTIGAVQRVWLNSPQPTEISPHLDQLAYMFSTMLRIHEKLYLGSTDQSFGGMIAMAQDQDVTLFGSNTYRRYEYTAPCRNDEIDRGYAVLEYTSLLNATPTNIQRLYSYGMENVAWQLSSIYLLVFQSTTAAAARDYHQPFLVVIKQLNSALQFTSDSLLLNIDNEIVVVTVVYMVLAGLLVALLIALLMTVYIPLLRHLINQSEGARLLLQMIPEKIRREVPAIHEFFQTGSVNTDIELINNACRETQSACLVVVSKDDIILQITAEGARRFRRTEKEVLGKPVEMLLSEDRGEVMVDFRRQYGVSRLSLFIGKKVRTRGRCSDGSTFPVQVTVREVCLSGRGTTADMSRCYICQFVNISIDAELEGARAFQAKVFGGSRRPQLIVDKRGVIRLVNQAAVKLFGYTDDELLGYNINSFVAANGLYEKDNFFSEYVTRLEQRMQQQSQQTQQQQQLGQSGGASYTMSPGGPHMHPYNSHAQSLYHAHGMASHRALSSTTLGTTVRRGVQARKRDGVLTELDIMIGVIPDVEGNAPLLMLHLTDLAAGYKTIQTDSISRLMLEKSPVPVLELNIAGRVNYFSPAAERSWGYSADQVTGWRLQSLLYGSDATRYRFDYQPNSDLLHFLDATRMLECRRADGTLFTAEVLMHMVRRASTVSIIAYFKDLTQEAAAAQRNIMSQWAFNTAFIPIVVTDGNGTVHSLNPAAERYFGFSAEEFAGQNITSVMIDSVAERPHYYREHYTMAVANTSLSPSQISLELDRSGHLVSGANRTPRTLGISLHNSIPSLSTSNNNLNNTTSMSGNVLRQEYVKRADGHFSSVEIRVQPLAVPDARMAQGIRHLYVNYIRDVNAQYAMQRMNDMQEEVTKHCPTPMLALSADGVVVSCNLAAGHLLGYHAENVIGMSLDELLPALHSTTTSSNSDGEEMRGWMSGGVRHLSALHRDGHAIPVELRLREVTKGTVETLFVATLIDISARSELENTCNTEQAYTNMYPLALIVANASGHVHFVSQEALRLFGLRSATDVVGTHLNLFLVESAATSELLTQLAQSGRNNSLLDTSMSLSFSATQAAPGRVYTLPCIREDKVSFRARVTVKRLLEGANSTSWSPDHTSAMSSEALYLLFVEDLTQPDILQQSCLLRTTLLTQLDFLAVLEVTTAGLVASVNDAFVRLFRLNSATDIVGRDLGLILRSAEQRALCEQKLRQCAAGMMESESGRQPRWTVEAVRRDNSRVSVEFTVLPPSAQNAEDKLCVLLRPMAELVDARDRATALRELIATAPVPVLLLRAAHPAKSIGGAHLPEGELVVEAFNAAAERVLRYTADEVMGQKVNDLLVIPPGASPSSHAKHDGSLSSGSETGPTLLQLYNEALAMLSTSSASSSSTSTTSTSEERASEQNGLMLLLSVRTKDGRLCPMRLSVLDISLAEEVGAGGAANGAARVTRLLVIAEEAAARLQRELSYRMSAALMDVCPLALVCLSEEYTIQLFSPQAERLFGFAESEVMGRPIQQLLFRTDNNNNNNNEEEDNNTVMDAETVLRPLMIRAMTPVRYLAQRKSAETVAVEVRMMREVQPRHSGAKYTLMIRDTSRDIADTTTGDLSVLTLQSLGLPFLILTPVGVLELVNKELAAMLGFSPRELIGRNLRTLMPSAMTERLAHYLDLVLSTSSQAPTSQSCYLVLRHHSGDEIAVVLTLHCHTSQMLQKISLYGFVRDVRDTVEVRTEAIVQEALASAQGNTLLLVNAQGTIDYASPTVRRLLGYDSAAPVTSVPHADEGNPLAADGNTNVMSTPTLLGQPLQLILPYCATAEVLSRLATTTTGSSNNEDGTVRRPARVSAMRADHSSVECELRVVELYDEVGERCYGCVLRSPGTASGAVRQEGLALRRVMEGLSLVGVLLLKRNPNFQGGSNNTTTTEGTVDAFSEMVISRVNDYALRLLSPDAAHPKSATAIIGHSLHDALPELLPAVRVLYERQRALLVTDNSAIMSSANITNTLTTTTTTPAAAAAQRKVMLYRKGHEARVIGVSFDEYIAPCGDSRWLLFISDETVLTELEAEVRTSYAILEALPMATLLVDDKGTVLHVSQAMRALAQSGAAAVGGAVGQNLSTLLQVEESLYAMQEAENAESGRRHETNTRLVPFDLSRHLHQGIYRVVVEGGQREARQRRAVLRIDELQGRVTGRTYLCILSEPNTG